MVAVPKRLVSGLDVATTVTVAVVGTLDGAVYKPLASILPQVGEHVVAVGEIGFAVVACTSSQVTSLGVVSVVSVAVNCKFAPVATVAVRGFTETRIPESSVMMLMPVFFLSALDVATTMIVGGGFGTVAGAVYVTVVGC